MRKNNIYLNIKKEYDELVLKNKKTTDANLDLEKIAEENIALYNITKDICKNLDIDSVFSTFYSEINNYVEVEDCKFIKNQADLWQYKDYDVLPLNINKNPVGYLLARGVKEADKDKFHILSQQFILGVKRALLYQRVQELAITDSLTGAFSRRYYLERFKEEILRSKKHKHSLSLVMVDIDHFKHCNDHYGHLVGDVILREISKMVKANIRQIDLLGRYGGEEFVILLTETDKEQARFAAERIRQAVEYMSIKAYDEDLKVTISIGIATFPDDAQELSAIIEKADWALYRAKQAGRNRVCMYTVYK